MIAPPQLSVTRALLPSITLLIAALAPSLAAAQDNGATFVYTVQQGDTCQGLAERFYGTKDAWAKVHQHNSLGAMPHHLRAGTTLVLPGLEGSSDPDAKLTAARGAVQARSPKEREWQKAQRGLDLYRAWRVNSLERSTAEITFKDTSALQMRENTIVIIYGTTSTRARKQTLEAELQSGALRHRLGELAGDSPKGSGEPALSLILSTASSITTLDDAAALVEADADGTTRVANHGGKPVEVAGRRKKAKSVKVNAGFGTRVKPAADPEPPRPLPPAPTWSVRDASGGAVTFTDRGTIRGSWEPIPAAAHYRVELAAAPGGQDVIQAVEVPANVTSFEIQNLPLGLYYVSVSAVDADRFEGPPSETTPRRLVQIAPRGAEATAGRWQQGMTLEVPDGARCTLGDAAPQAQLVLTQAGAAQLRCVDAEGRPLEGSQVEVEAASVQLSSSGQPLTELTLAEGQPLPLQLTVEAPHLQALTPTLEAPAGVTVAPLQRVAPGRWETSLTAGPGAAEGGALEVRFTINDARLPLASLPITLTRSGSAAEPEDGWAWMTLGAHFGYGVVASDDAYGDSTLASSPRLGLTLTLQPLRALAFGVEGSFARPEVEGAGSASLLGVRGWGRWALTDGLLRPLLLLGGGVERLSAPSLTVPQVSAGAGLQIQGESAVGVNLIAFQHLSLLDGLDPGTTELRLTVFIDLF